MTQYNLVIDILFVILAIGAAFALVSEHPILSSAFYIIALLLVYFERQTVEYVRSA